jgi:hypothetical protein
LKQLKLNRKKSTTEKKMRKVNTKNLAKGTSGKRKSGKGKGKTGNKGKSKK